MDRVRTLLYTVEEEGIPLEIFLVDFAFRLALRAIRQVFFCKMCCAGHSW